MENSAALLWNSKIPSPQFNAFFSELFNINVHPSTFIIECLLAAGIASFVGGFIDVQCDKMQSSKTNRLWSAFFFFVQLLITIVFLGILIWLWPGFFNWALSSIGGVIFITLLFISQGNFQKNTLNTFDV